MRTPIAWLNLWHDKIRLSVAIAGVAFADILIFSNLGFLGSVAESASMMYHKINADIYLTSPRSLDLNSSQSFPRERLYQVAGIEGVDRAMPLYMGYLMWRNPQTQLSRAIFVYAINPHDPVFLIPELQSPKESSNQSPNQLSNQSQNQLSNHQTILAKWDTVLIDRQSRSEFGPTIVGTTTEAGRRQITIGGQFEFGSTFAADGNVIMSDQNFLRYFSPRPLNRINLGLITLKPTADVTQIANAMRQILPADVLVMTKQEMIDRDENFWINTSSTGFIFTLGVAVSCVVGTVIVYQILYTDISNHLKQYATLKAIGYHSRYLFIIVIQEALILAILGYIPALGISIGLYELTTKAANITMIMDFGRVITVLLLTIGMCTLSALVSVQKAITADPADVF
jgi:putative ABC transport system permease protein